MTTHRTRIMTSVAATAVAIAISAAACSSSGDSSTGPTTTTSAPSGPAATGAAPIVPFNPGERAGLGPWQLTLVGATPGAATTVDVALTNPSGRAAAPPPVATFELVDLSTRQRYQVASSTGLDAKVPGRGTVPVTLTFSTGTAPADAVLAWKGSTRGSVDAAFALTAASTRD